MRSVFATLPFLSGLAVAVAFLVNWTAAYDRRVPGFLQRRAVNSTELDACKAIGSAFTTVLTSIAFRSSRSASILKAAQSNLDYFLSCQPSAPRSIIANIPLLAVGTFNTNELFTVLFDPEKETLELLEISQAKGYHSWLSTATIPKSSSSATSPTHLYATCWTQPPSVAAYRIQRDGPNKARFELLNSAETAARSGYVYVGFPAKAAHPVLYSCGGPTGEEIDFVTGECSVPGKTLAQTLELKRREAQKSTGDDSSTDSATTKLDASGGKNAMDFGGLRHGSHGIDLSPEGGVCYIPDIGRNCVWTMNVDPTSGALSVGEQSIAPRKDDGPRHTVSHPGGRYIYSLQEYSSMVEVFELIKDAKGTRLEWKQGVKIIPQSEDEGLYWADEVRLSCPSSQPEGEYPLYMFASTRGLASGTKGAQYAVLTDSEVGVVRMLRLDVSVASQPSNVLIKEVATLDLGNDAQGKLREAATAVWI
ncbi:related to muconate cycloisomerase [Ustilago sp. UG-2017b]|nr:related to muconate cycloisomerase [Ustilago sp. UG-2017b]